MKKFFIVLISLSAISFAQNLKVTKTIQNAFTKLYPNATELKWSKEEDNEFEASFRNNGLATSVVLNSKGDLLETETEIKLTDLPKGVEEWVIKNRKDYKITEAMKIVNEKGNITYEVEITKGKVKKDLMFSEQGQLVKK